MNTQTLHLLQQTTEHITSHHQQAYLVGGSLRNILLETPGIDWDIAITGDAPLAGTGPVDDVRESLHFLRALVPRIPTGAVAGAAVSQQREQRRGEPQT